MSQEIKAEYLVNAYQTEILTLTQRAIIAEARLAELLAEKRGDMNGVQNQEKKEA